ncbi:M4 family metallopeptidase [Hymenobacter arizonensis]|uniref:Por secretion system C-terminal sorting domain-containing protein n=1 Tax=Hymenobacter arizonensis TaxID=1227077 RepID=A0A1I6B4X7_HYMAR|nr:M4 family metallopeptidase [Hymenobacter arizonensis]SFQ75981.1 Por secretion system C-terminal sorting domain-containing protein [Hymenobacter arizonensis]
MRKQYSTAALLLLGTLAATTAQAQDAARIKAKVMGPDNQPELVEFNAAGKASYKAADAALVLRQQLALTDDDQLRPGRTETDQLGFTHQKFAQFYKGVRVEHADYNVHAKGGAVESISGDFEKIKGLNTTPALKEAAALRQALAKVGARKYMWQDPAEEAGLKEQENDQAATYAPKGELVVVRDSRRDAENGPLVLAWKFNIYAQQPVSRAYIYVDARTGEVVLQDNIIKHAAATGTFGTRYSGTVSSATETTTGGYYLREFTRGSGIETYNARKGNSYTAAVDFIDADNSWTEYNNANFDNAALDAHWGAQSTYDYFKNVHARNSYNNAGAKIKSYVHFDDTPSDGKGFENAYWNGSVMTYGDGDTRFQPLTSLDVAAHEIGHAVCSSTANLTYSNESGALNEGFSDIWGACVEYYKAPSKQTWLIGEDIDKVRPALRSMSNPNAEGQPDTYKGTSWYAGTGDNGGVHTNSGVLNHWFYRLTVGGSGTNDLGTAYSVTGIGIDAAAKIAYRTESVYLTASSNYAAARTYSIQSAKDLYGAGSAQEIAVTNAWSAVGVGAAYSGGSTPPATVTYCTSKGSSVAYEWIDYVKLGTLARTSAADGGYYNGTALAAPSIGAGTSQTVSFSAGFAGTAYTEYWKIYIDYNKNGVFTDAGELVVSGSSSSAATLSGTFTVPTTAKTGTTRMRVIVSDNSATTSCNSYSYGETEDYTVNITGGAALAADSYSLTGAATPLGNEMARTLEVYPNPATNAVRLVLPGNAEATSVVLTDIRGVRVSGASYSNGTLNVSSLAKGMYTLSVSDGQKVFHQRFVKE